MNVALMLCLFAAAAAQSPDQIYRRGVELLEQGNLEAAQRTLEGAARLQPESAQVWKALGVVYAMRGDHPMAEPAFGKACELAPALDDACFYHGRALYLTNRFDQAIERLRRIEAKDTRAHRVIALSLEGLGRWPEAEAEYRKAIRLHRSGEDPRIDYGVALLRQGRTQEALGPLEASVKAAPNNARAHLELGRALMQLERLEAALLHLARAVALDPKFSTAHLLLGKLYLRLNRPEQAETHLREGARSAQ